MKKIILLVVLVIILAGIGGAAIYAKDAPIFDVFFSEEAKESREFNRMANLYPEKIGDFLLYSRSQEKISKDVECQEMNETLNTQGKEIKGEVCVKFTRGEYRNAENKAVFVHIFKITKGKEIPNFMKIFGASAPDKIGSYNIMRPENHEISWFPAEGYGMDLILTQEGIARQNPDGGESMLYQNKATGDNPVTKYFLSKFQPATEE